jgi:hypothetical protein
MIEEKWIPDDSEIKEILEYLKENYPIKIGTFRTFDDSEQLKYFIIDEKLYYLEGWLYSKTTTRKKLYYHIIDDLYKFKTASINKAMKMYLP